VVVGFTTPTESCSYVVAEGMVPGCHFGWFKEKLGFTWFFLFWYVFLFLLVWGLEYPWRLFGVVCCRGLFLCEVLLRFVWICMIGVGCGLLGGVLLVFRILVVDVVVVWLLVVLGFVGRVGYWG